MATELKRTTKLPYTPEPVSFNVLAIKGDNKYTTQKYFESKKELLEAFNVHNFLFGENKIELIGKSKAELIMIYENMLKVDGNSVEGITIELLQC